MNPTRILITTGPESSGKTTLASELAAALRAPLVNEVSRPYLTLKMGLQPGFQYQYADLLAIAQQQHASEQRALQENPGVIVCDTDLLVIIIWSQVRFGQVDPWIVDTFNDNLRSSQRHYLLCDHNIPWQYDPLRENPHDRPMLAQRYVANLLDYGCTNVSISGSPAERLAASLAWLAEISGLPHLPR